MQEMEKGNAAIVPIAHPSTVERDRGCSPRKKISLSYRKNGQKTICNSRAQLTVVCKG